MADAPLYTASSTASGAGRNGRAETSDGALSVTLTMPKELGGAGGEGTNPEQLFATGYAGCFLSALQMVARQEKVKLDDASRITADVGIVKQGAGFGLTVTLRADLPGLEPATVDDLLEKAHAVCPYSNATRGNIPVDLARA